MGVFQTKEFEKLDDRLIKVMLSCKTLEHWECAIRYINLAERQLNRTFPFITDKWMIAGNSAFKRGFCHGYMQRLKETNNECV